MAAKIVFSGGAELDIPGETAESVTTMLTPAEDFVRFDSEEGSAYVLPGQVAYVRDIEDIRPSAIKTEPVMREQHSESEFA
jgi:hypothetical protein